MQLSTKKLGKIFGIVVVLLMTLVLLTALPVMAQEDEPHGGAPGAITGGPLPAGVTPTVTLETISYISVRPNPVGVGQPILVNIWVQPPLHVTRAHTGYSVIFTSPSGKETVVGPVNSFTADTTYWFEYVFDEVGTWKYQFTFDGDYYPSGWYLNGVRYANLSDVPPVPPGETLATTASFFADTVYYKPSKSAKYDLVVQQEQLISWLPSPLPTDYWTRPISIENREWWIIGGNNPYYGVGGGEGWPENTNAYRNNYDFVPYVQGPSSAHIVWKRLGSLSGIFGGAYGTSSAFLAYGGGAFQFGPTGPGNSGNPNIVYMGRVYQTVVKEMPITVNGSVNTLPTNVWQCYDLRTGEIFWELTGITSPPTVISYEANVPAVPGAVFRIGASTNLVSLSGNRLIKYNPLNGAVNLNITLASPALSSSTVYADPYVLSIQDLGSAAGANRYRLINWSMLGTSTNFTTRIQRNSNITYPFSSLGTADFEAMVAVTAQGQSTSATGVSIGNRFIGVSLTNGQVLWNVTTEMTSGTQGSFSGSTAIADHGKYAIRFNDGKWHCYDMRTGNVAWVSELTSYPWGTFGAYAAQSAYGLLFYEQYDGVVAYDWDTGDVVWRFSAPSIPYETPYQGQYSWFSDAIVADGKLYSYTVEHSPTAPITRGQRLFCLNATTGAHIWNITGATAPGLVADGYMTGSSYYDGYLYVYGKGKSATTVTASQKTIAKGATVLIEGTVLDQSPSQPNTPCVSKESMTEYMEYLHLQHVHPASVVGVPVALSAIRSDGGFVDIGTVTTNGYYGTFSHAWTPPDEATYTIVASFNGDQSYGSSSAATGLHVGAAVETQEPPNIDLPPDNTMLLYGILVAVVIAILIGLVAIALVLRKH